MWELTLISTIKYICDPFVEIENLFHIFNSSTLTQRFHSSCMNVFYAVMLCLSQSRILNNNKTAVQRSVESSHTHGLNLSFASLKFLLVVCCCLWSSEKNCAIFFTLFFYAYWNDHKKKRRNNLFFDGKFEILQITEDPEITYFHVSHEIHDAHNIMFNTAEPCEVASWCSWVFD